MSDAISLYPTKIDLYLYKGDTISMELNLLDSSKLPIDLFTNVTNFTCSGIITMTNGAETISASIGYINPIISKVVSSGAKDSNTITVDNIADLMVGMRVIGSGIAPGATISSINTSTKVVSLSVANTASAVGTAIFDNKLSNGLLQLFLSSAESDKLHASYSDKKYEIQIKYTKNSQNIVKTVLYGKITVTDDIIS